MKLQAIKTIVQGTFSTPHVDKVCTCESEGSFGTQTQNIILYLFSTYFSYGGIQDVQNQRCGLQSAVFLYGTNCQRKYSMFISLHGLVQPWERRASNPRRHNLESRDLFWSIWTEDLYHIPCPIHSKYGNYTIILGRQCAAHARRKQGN